MPSKEPKPKLGQLRSDERDDTLNDTGIDSQPLSDPAIKQSDAPPATNVKTRVVREWTEPTPAAANIPAAPLSTRNAPGATPDATGAFLDEFDDGNFYSLQVIREPDPMTRRPPNQTFRRPNFGGREILGVIPFSRGSFFTDLQALNGGSGGSFLVEVYDQENMYCSTWRGTIADPLTALMQAPPPTTIPEKKESDGLIGQLKQLAEIRTLLDGLNGPRVPSEQEQLLNLFGKPELIGQFTGTISTAMRAAMEASTQSIKQPAGAKEMAMQAILDNPELQEKISAVGLRVLDLLTDLVAPRNGVPASRAIAAANPSDETPEAPPDDLEYKLIRFLAEECAEGTSVTATHPIFAEYGEAEPQRFAMFKIAMRTMTVEKIIDFVIKRAETYGRANFARMVWQRPEGAQWVQTLKDSFTKG
jgi:hypothetical protein